MTMDLIVRAPAPGPGTPDPVLAIIPATPDGDRGPTGGVTGITASRTVGDMGDAPDGAPGATLATLPTADERMIGLWLHGKAPLTQRLYRRHIALFTTFVGSPLAEVTLDDVQAFETSLAPRAPSTRTLILAGLKSLLSFGHRTGLLRVNVGAALRLHRPTDDLAERILTEPEVHRLLAAPGDPRDRALLRLAYAAALRVSELVSLRWRNLQDRDGGGGQVTVVGKGQKRRYVLVRPSVWAEIRALAAPSPGPDPDPRDAVNASRRTGTRIEPRLPDGSLNPDAPVFRSRNGGFLSPMQVWRIIRRAASTAGISGNVSPHWLRHAHASHALDRGAPIHLVRDGLGHANLSTTSRYAHARPNEHSEKFLAL